MYSNNSSKNLFLGLASNESRGIQTVGSAFNKFYNKITLTGDQRDTCQIRRDDIVSSLKKDFEILDAFATGSVPKYTALRKPHSDLDVMIVLHYGKHVRDRKPSEVLQAVRDSLAGWRTNVRKNGQAVTLYYKTWPNVDIVPVARVVNDDGSVNHYTVPDMNTEEWIKSRPRKHGSALRDRASSYGAEFRRIIKMVKWWNLHHSEYLRSYHLEVLALEILTGSFSDYPWDIFQFFDKACTLVQNSLWYEDSFVDDYLDYWDRQETLKRLETARDKARVAWHATYGDFPNHSRAMEIWQQIFGDQFPTNS